MSRPKPLFLLLGILLSLPVLSGIVRGEESPGPWKLLQKIPLDDEAWRWNSASWDQEKIVSFGDFQYTVYWDSDRVFVLARRDLRDNTVQTLRLEQFTLTSDDPHRNTCLGISPQDGRLHFTWDHHNNPLNYTRTRAGFLTDPPERITVEDIEPEQPITADRAIVSRVTYPRFLNDAQGSLFLWYRQGGSGNGDNYLHRYRAEDGTWSLVGKVFSSRGTYAPCWNNSQSRNAYFHDVLFDSNNHLHATWVYREMSATWASNHDLHYAHSDDSGRTWYNNAGQEIADTAEGDPIELSDPGIVVWEVPVFSWIMNAGCMALDSKNRPHVITYKLPAPQRPDELKHNPPAEILQDLRFVHYWRDEDGTWRGGEPIGETEAGNVARGDIVFGADDTLYFIYPNRKGPGFRCLEARAADQWQQWRSYRFPVENASSRDASKHDRRRWTEEGILSFAAQFGQQGFGIVELTLQKE